MYVVIEELVRLEEYFEIRRVSMVSGTYLWDNEAQSQNVGTTKVLIDN